MRKTILILSIFTLCLLLAPGAGAQGMGLFDWEPPWADEVEQIDPADWADGQYVTYHLTVDNEGETVSGDIRLAIVGEEQVDGEDFYWLEFDLFNIGDIPDETMIDEPFESLRVKILMNEYDLTAAEDDPEAFMEDLFSLEFINRVIFQMNDEIPYEIDMSFLQMFAPMMEMAMQEGEGMGMEDEVVDKLEDMDWGYEQKTVTTQAGSFSDALNLWFEAGDESAKWKMKIFAHADVPLTTIVKLVGEIEDNYEDRTVDINLELIKYGNDATTMVKGDPQLFDFDMMGEMMGGM